jgi:hypothetical protein
MISLNIQKMDIECFEASESNHHSQFSYIYTYTLDIESRKQVYFVCI